MGLFADLLGTLRSTFRVGRATFDSSSLTTVRSFVLPDQAGMLALRGNHTSTAISKTLAANEICTLTAPGLTITLPPKAAGISCGVVTGDFVDTVINPATATLGGVADTGYITVRSRLVMFFCDGENWSY